MNLDIATWMLVFVRVSGLFLLFPVFAAPHMPARTRIALAALSAALVTPGLPTVSLSDQGIPGMVILIGKELGVGVLMGFVSRLIFYAAEAAGALINSEIGLSLPQSMNPISGGQGTLFGTILNYSAGMTWLCLDLHHWLLAGILKTFNYLPVGTAQWREPLLMEILDRCSGIFVVALQMAAPLMAVSFIISLVLSTMGRAVPQMNVFLQSFSIRILAGLTVFGATCHLMSQHIANYLNRLPEDLLRIGQLLGQH